MKTLLSAITSSGQITIGNYLGAIKNIVNLQDEYKVYLFVANLHALTNCPQPKLLNENIHKMIALYFACGINPNKAIVFLQSDILEHCQLAHILLCNTYMGELNRMTQFKDKGHRQSNNTTSIPTGLFTYPTLMAADILLYDIDIVPVGKDQIQHLELTRDIAIRMNDKYNTNFRIPEKFIDENTNKIMDLQDPTKKMSKSNEKIETYISLLDDIEVIKNKIKKAVTDSENKVYYDVDKKPGISNLLRIYAGFKNINIKTAEQEFINSNYGEFKTAVSNIVCEKLQEIQQKYYKLINSKEIEKWLELAKKQAKKQATKKLQEVQKQLGINY